MSSSSSDENESQLQRRKNEFDKAKETTKNNYIREYERFMEWKMFNNEEHLDENVLLKYFKELSERAKAQGKCSNLYPTYTKLMNVIAKEHDLLIEPYARLKAFMKDPQIAPYSRRPEKTFTSDNIETFLNHAPDDHYLVMKVALIFGVSGACKSRELSAIKVDDIQPVSEELIMVNVRGADNNDDNRSFIVCGDHVNIVNKYLAMRLSLHNISTNKFFILYRKGKFVKQAMHKNNFNQMARKIASFINLANPELYRQNCFRKTSAKLVSVVGEGFSNKKERVRIVCKPKNKKSERKSFKNEERLKKMKRKSLKREQAQAPAKSENSKSLFVTEDPKPNICINIGDKSIKMRSTSDYWSKCSDSLPNLNLVSDGSTVKCFTWEESKNRDPLAANDSFVNNSDVSDSGEDSSDDDSPIIKKKKETTVKHVFKDCENVSNLFISL